jgi:hypothetical protein
MSKKQPITTPFPPFPGYSLIPPETFIWMFVFSFPPAGFVAGTIYLFFGDTLLAPRTPTQLGRAMVLASLIGTLTYIVFLFVLIQLGVSFFLNR